MPLKTEKEPDESTVPDLEKGPMEESSEQKVQPVTARMAVNETIFSLTEMFRSFMQYLKEHDNRQESETVRREQNFKVLNHHITQMQLEIDRIRLGAITNKPVPRVTDQELCLARLKDTDDIDHYLLTFERLAETYQWSKEDWASYLKPFLTGEARSAFDAMDPVHAKDYDSVKTAILKKCEIRPETFKQRFRNPNTPADESPQELYARLKDLFCKWVNYDSSTKRDIMETLVLEQYLQVLHPDVRTWVKERDPATAEVAASLVEAYITARKGTGSSFCYAGILSLTRGFASPGQSLADKPLQTASLTQSSTLAPLSGFGDKFRPPAGSWICGTCVVQNKSSDKKCVVCLEPQPNIKTNSESDSKPADSMASPSSLFAPLASSWECDTCLVRNKPDVVKCVACDTAKPGTGVKSSMTLLPLAEVSYGISAVSFTSSTTTTTSTGCGLLGFGDKFKKPEGSWDCDVCMVQNKAQDVKCVACQSAKPDSFSVAVAVAASTPAPLLGFRDNFKKSERRWKCEVCRVQNKTNDQKCVACRSAKPGSRIMSKGLNSFFGIQFNSTDSSSSSFKFGTGFTDFTSAGLKFGGTFSDSSSSTGGFKLGSSDITSNLTGFKFGGSFSDATSDGIKLGSTSSETTTSTSGDFKFGGCFATTPACVSEEKKTESQDSSTAFKFGSASGFSFGSQDDSSENSVYFGAKPVEKGSLNSLLTFSVPQSKVEKDDARSPFEPVSTTTTSSAANTIPVFGKPLVAESKLAAPKCRESATTVPTQVMPTFTFEKPEDKKDISVPFSALLISAANEAEKSTPSLGFSFGKQDPPKDLPKPLFTIGKPAETEPAEPLKPSFTFGQRMAAPAPAANQSPFDFGSKLTLIFGQGATAFGSAAPSFSATACPAPAFGAKPSLFPGFGQKLKPAPTFGSAAASTGQESPVPAFGAKPSFFPVFGQKLNPAPTFGSAAASTGQGGFQMGAALSTPAASPAMPAVNAPSSGGFNFGQTPQFKIGSTKISTVTPSAQNSTAGCKIKADQD